MNNKSIICDIDGTLSLRGEREPFDFKTADSDKVNIPLKTIVIIFYFMPKDLMHTILIVIQI